MNVCLYDSMMFTNDFVPWKIFFEDSVWFFIYLQIHYLETYQQELEISIFIGSPHIYGP